MLNYRSGRRWARFMRRNEIILRDGIVRAQRIDEILERESVLFLPFDERYTSDEILDTHSDARNNIIAVYFVRSVVYEIFRPWWYINNIIRQNISYVVIYKQYAEYFVALYATEYLIRGITSNIASRNISFVALYMEYFVRGDTQTILYCIWTFRDATSNIVSRNISFVASYTKYLVRVVTSNIVLRNIGVMYEIFRPWWYINNIVLRNISSHY